VVTIITNVIISGRKRPSFSLLLLEYDFCLLNCITVDFIPQIQTSTQKSESYIRFDESYQYLESSPTRLSTLGISGTKGNREQAVHGMYFNARH
jgi:hypothetical protein